MDRIDAHRHLFNHEKPEEVLRQMDRHGIARSILMPMPGSLDFLNASMFGNAEVFAFLKARPDRLSSAVYLDLREPGAAEELRRYAGLGAVAVKLWPPIGFFPDRPEYYPVYEEIERLGLPVMIHTGVTDCGLRGGAARSAANSKFSMPIELDGLIRAFPRITWIYAHAGNPDFATAIHHAANHANVCLNINGMADGSGWDARLFAFYERMQGACAPLPWDRLMWGTDNIGVDFENYDRLFERAGQGKHLPAFYSGNARRVFRLPPG